MKLLFFSMALDIGLAPWGAEPQAGGFTVSFADGIQRINVKAGHGAKWAGLAASVWLLAFNASAQQPSAPGQGDDVRPQGMGQGSMGPGPHRQQRGRGDGSGPQVMGPGTQPARFAADDPAAPRGGQMSKEERRQLRRDVDQAGRDLYPERRRGGHHHQPPPGQAPPEPAPAR